MYGEILRNRNFMRLVSADIISRFGDSVDAIAFTWLTYEISKSAVMSALVFAMNVLPTALFQPIFGPIAERCKKKPVLVMTDLIRAALVGAVLLLFAAGALRPFMMLAFTFAMNSVEAMRIPCGSSFMVKLISEKEYDSCLSFSKTACTAAQLIGTAAGGILAAWQITGAFAVDFLTFLSSAVLIWGIAFSETTQQRPDQGVLQKLREYIRELMSGFQYMLGSRLFKLLILSAILYNMESTVLSSLLAPYAAQVFGGGGEVLSVLNFFLTAGMLVSMYFYPKVTKRLSYKKQLIWPFAVLAVYYLLLLAIPGFREARYILLALFSFGNGLALGVITIFFNVMFVKIVHSDYMARATGVFNSSVTLAMPAVSFLIAALVKWIPVTVMFLTAGAFGLSCALLFTFWKVTDALSDKM